MHELTSTGVVQAVEDAIRKWIPDVQIMRPWATGGFRPVTLPLNVFTEIGGVDTVTGAVAGASDRPNREQFPYVFIEALDRLTTGRERMGHTERFHYEYFISVRFYISIDPFDREQIPKLNEELDTIDLKLERVLQYLEMWDGLVQTTNRRMNKEAGVLHTFFNVAVYEDDLLPEIEPVEAVDIGFEVGDVQ